MKNIFEIMKEYGLEVPEDKKKDFEKAVLENYKTQTDYDNQTKKLDAANETIKANDTAMKDLQTQLDGFKDVDVTDSTNESVIWKRKRRIFRKITILRLRIGTSVIL